MMPWQLLSSIVERLTDGKKVFPYGDHSDYITVSFGFDSDRRPEDSSGMALCRGCGELW